MKELLITVALLILGIILARLVLSDSGLLGASKSLFLDQLRFLAQ